MHDRLVGFILKVRVPAALEVRRRPGLHLLQFFFSWANFDTSIDAIGRQWASTLEIPFVEHLFLDLRDATDEVVETLCFCDYLLVIKYWGNRVCVWLTGLSTIDRECQIMILEVQPHTREVDDRLDASLFQLLWVTNTTALKNQWR